MAIDVWLVDATPHRLIYKCHFDGEAPGTYTIPNQGGVTPDLRTDALNGAGTTGGIPINDVLRARFVGYPRQGAGVIAAGGLTQAQARAVMASDDAARAVITNRFMPRCRTEIHSMLPVFAWSADWNVDVDGDPDCDIVCALGVEGWALLSIWFRHSFNR